ncbi:MAG: hypothetical protein CL928_12895 [Deltaproteobacteria bacterium]|nr:hypothetical protein [Deltaproteobacteria bacterium]
MSLHVANSIGAYDLDEVLGMGSRTAVHRGRHRSIEGLEAAVKVLHPTLASLPQVREELRSEAEVLARLRHPHIERVLDFIEDGELCALVMELVPGRPLRAVLADSDEVLSVRRVLRIFRTLTEALGHAHGAGLPHGRLTPHTVMLTERDDVKLLDFGRARSPGQKPAAEDLPYCAPEARAGGALPTEAGDLYSLARLVEALLFGREVRERPATAAALEEAGAPEGLVRLLRRMTRDHSAERAGSCGEVLSALDRLGGSRINQAPVQRLELGICDVDLVRREVLRDGQTERLTTNEANLLSYLAMNPGRVVTRDQLMRDVWGTRGQVVTRAVDVAVRRLRKKIEPSPADPSFILTVHGQGYRYEPPESVSATVTGASASPALQESSTPSSAPTEASVERALVTQDGRTVQGRQQALSDLAELFEAGARLVTLTGPGGMGKTLLAQVFVETQPPAFLEDTASWFCDLQTARDREGLSRAVAGTLGVALDTAEGDDDEQRIGQFLAGQGACLVLLDNFEQLVDSSAGVVQAWMQAAPEARFLLTSQALLNTPGERVYELAPLSEDAAVALFVDRARELRYDFQPDEAADQDIRAIVTGLDRIPLAIELAASRIRMLSTQQLRERLAQRFDLLRTRSAGTSDRSATLRGAIEWSWQLLSPAEQHVLAQATIFAGGCWTEAAESVIELPRSRTRDAAFVLDLLQGLVDKSLLRCVSIPGLPGRRRFVFFESIYAFASEHLAALTSLSALVDRHRAYYLKEAERLAELREGPQGLEASRLLELEIENLLLIESQCGLADSEVAVRIAVVLEPLLNERGPPGVYERLLNSALEHAQDQMPGLELDLLYARALWRRQHRLDVAGSVADAERIELVAQQSGVPLLVARAVLYRAGALLVPTGQVADAEALVRGVLHTVQAEGRPRDILLAHKHLSHFAEFLGDYQEAEVHSVAGLELARAEGLRRQEGRCLRRHGLLLCNQGRPAEAEGVLREAIEINESFENLRSTAGCLGLLGESLLILGRHEDCERVADESVRLATLLGDVFTVAMVRALRGRLALDCGDFQAALDHLEESQSALSGWPVAQAMHQLYMAMTRLHLSQPSQALELGNSALQVFSPTTHCQGRVHTLCTVAAVCAQLGDQDGVERALDEAAALTEGLAEVDQLLVQWCSGRFRNEQKGRGAASEDLLSTLGTRSLEFRVLSRLS